MVRKDGDTMKECMKTNNPTDFRECLKNFPLPEKNPCVKEEFGYDLQSGTCWHEAKVVNTTYSVNLRAEPTLDSAVISRIHPDSTFMISAIRAADWYKVRLKDGTEGYASSKFVARVMPDEHT